MKIKIVSKLINYNNEEVEICLDEKDIQQLIKDKAEEKGILAYNGYDWLHSQPKIMDVICYD